MDQKINVSPEAKAFIEHIVALPKQPGVSLDPVLAKAVEKEAELRRLFAQDRKNSQLNNPYVGLVDLFDAPQDIRLTRARIVENEEDRSSKYVFPVPDEKRRKEGELSVVNSIEDFQKNWSIFTEGSLFQLKNWNNVIAAGGSVLACLLPLSARDGESRRTVRKFYHSAAYPTSDIDLFLWGLTPEQAEEKISEIYDAVRDSIPWDATCVRTKHAISIHSQYPYRSVQIVLRLYHSPAEILAGFDVDAPCVAYDGTRILANPRSIIALMRQANTVDMTRRSPSYEVRLAKYASRGFEVYVPDLRRADIDPTIYERSLARITGLARLLVLEKLSKPEARVSYLESRRELRSRVRVNTIYTRRMRRKRKGDLKAEVEIAGLDMNDYDVAQLHIPYGPGWTAKRIEKLIYSTDLGINSTFNPKNKDRRLHRHVAFFGTLKECIEDLCEYCPAPRDEAEKTLQEEEDKQYIRGRISFIEEDPGRQSMTGSFNPIDVGEWSELAYLGTTERLFTAIVANERDVVKQFLGSGEIDINRRDHVGRTALQVAALRRAEDICLDLVDADARMSARLADGRTSLHIAAQMGLPALIEKMLLRSNVNAEKAKEEEEAKAKAENKSSKMDVDENGDNDDDDDEGSVRASSEDDWSSDENDSKKKKKEENKESENQPDADADIPEDNAETPDVLDVNLPDWDFALTPLDYAVIAGSKSCVQALLNGGADVKLFTKAKDYSARSLNPLAAVVLLQNQDKAQEIIDLLLRAGATSSQAGNDLFSIFHAFINAGRIDLVKKLLQADPTANAVINIPRLENSTIYYPLTTAIARGHYSLAVLLIGYGAKVSITPEDSQKVRNMQGNQSSAYHDSFKTPHELEHLRDTILPAECSLATHSYMLKLLVQLGAQVSAFCTDFYNRGRYNENSRLSLIDTVREQIKLLKKEKEGTEKKEKTEYKTFDINSSKSFAEMRTKVDEAVKALSQANQRGVEKFEQKKEEERASKYRKLELALTYYEETESLLMSVNAQTYEELVASHPDSPTPRKEKQADEEDNKNSVIIEYETFGKYSWNSIKVLPHLMEQYDALFDACWTGNNSRIKDLCMPKKDAKSGKSPLQIAVLSKTSDTNNRWGVDGIYTPFSVAIIARRWDTAKLILSIVSSQYKPYNEEANDYQDGFRVRLCADTDSEDSDGNSEGYSDDGMDVDENGPETITDVIDRVPGVQCDISPMKLLNARVSSRVSRDGKKYIGSNTILRQACIDGDLEAFVNICNMIAQLPEHATDREPRNLDDSYLNDIVRSDCPELLDEFIRRTGLGISLRELVEIEDTNKDDHPHEKISSTYLGLTVHGKKRKDLARRDEHATRNTYRENESLPILWDAIQYRSSKIVDYLYGPGPLAAYRYYATTKTTERAEELRLVKDLQDQLPRLLGVLPNARRESALTAAIVLPGGEESVSLAKKVLELSPVPNLLRTPLAFTGWTPLHLAAARDLPTSFFDYLFSNGVSAEETDNVGMNIYHIVCRVGHINLLKYFLEKLPKDVSNHLLSQQLRKFGDTPLMLAIRLENTEIVEVLLSAGFDSVKESLEIRNAKGLMPIHAAIQTGSYRITELIINAAPDSESLYSENSVGETPLEYAYTKWLSFVTRNASPFAPDGNNRTFIMNGYSANIEPGPPSAEKLTKELDTLKTIYEFLMQTGKLSTNAKLREALDEFVVYLTQKRDEMQKLTPVPDPSKRIGADYMKLIRLVSSSIRPEKRNLVHLIDVQRSVSLSLSKATAAAGNRNDDEYNRRRRLSKIAELPDEVDAEIQQRKDQWKGVLARGFYYTNLSEYHM